MRRFKIVNAETLENGMRVMNVCKLPDGEKIRIITEADRSVTALLFPEEY